MTSTIKVDTISENTSANGVAVDGVTLKDGGAALTGNLTIDDDSQISLGASADLVIRHNAANGNSFIQDTGTGGLTIQANSSLSLQSYGSSENFLVGTSDAGVKLYHNGNERLETTADGVSVSGLSVLTSNTPILTFIESDQSNKTYKIGSFGSAFSVYDDSNTQFRYIIDTNGNHIFNEGSQDCDFRIESNGNTHAFFVNGGDDSIGLFNSSPAFTTGSGMHLGDEVAIGFGAGGSGRPDFQLRANSTNLKLACGFGSDDTDININTGGKISTGGEQGPDVDAGGLTLNQTSNDGFILTMKSSDVAHGMTDLGETDTYAYFKKSVATEGGLELNMATEGVKAGQIQGFATSIDNNKATDSNANITVRARLKSGTAWGVLGSNGNLFSIANHNTTRFIFDSEGDFHADSSSTTFDAYDDAQLVRAYDLSHGRGVINSKFDEYVKYQHEDLAKAGLVGREQDGSPNHYINVTGFQRLHNGAIWQQYEKTQRLTQAMYELAKVAVGEEKANEILEQNEIKLLN